MRQKLSLGARETQILEVISDTADDLGDILVGFLLSACSTKRMYHIAKKRARNRAQILQRSRSEKQRLKQALKKLEKEGLIRLSKGGPEQRVKVTKKGTDILNWDKVTKTTKAKSQIKKAWDGKWTIVFFDVPTQQKGIRYSLSSLLRKCGFMQTQMSVYVFPYECPELVQALMDFPTWGRYCQVVRGKYYGDDLKLRKEFSLAS